MGPKYCIASKVCIIIIIYIFYRQELSLKTGYFPHTVFMYICSV